MSFDVSPIPDLIDNQDGNDLEAALNALTGAPLSIATGFFTPAGLVRIAPALRNARGVRLLIGVEPPRHGEAHPHRIGESPARRLRRQVSEERAVTEAALRGARDRYPFTPEARTALAELAALAAEGRIEARLYVDRFLHAKAFIAGGETPRVIAGSGNATVGGLSRNLELALGATDDTARMAQAWFDDLWSSAEDWDLAGYLGAMVETYTPWEVYIRMLLALYGDQLEEFEQAAEGLKLTEFQRHGVAQALHIMRARGGVIVADEVGLGKTYIAGEIMALYHARRQRVLLVCPATLRDGTWKRFIAAHSFDLTPEVVSYEQLAMDRQLGGSSDILQRPLDEYQLVVVDEAHNYRNPAAETRAKVLHRLLQGRKRDVLLLTATPVNNSIWDLYHAIRTFVRQDAGLADVGIVSLRDKFRRAAALEPSELNPDHLFSVIDATCVKRTRQFIRTHYADDTIEIDGTPQAITFPKANALSVRYDVDGPMSAMFDALERYLDPSSLETLRFARYDTVAYRDDPDPDEAIGVAIGLLRSGLLKRAESSAHAFARSLGRMLVEHAVFLEALDRGYVIGTEILRELASGVEEDDIDTFLGASDARPSDTFDAAKLRQDVEADIAKLDEMRTLAEAIDHARDPKIDALLDALRLIRSEAESEGVGADDVRLKGKVLLFSYYADTVAYIREALDGACETGPLAPYGGRIASVSGGDVGDVPQVAAATGFTPRTSGAPGAEDLYDILVTTDILAEGVNLQDCRHVINFDVPWNPMRLVQRHGRVDRIGSRHSDVFLRTVFPAKRLDALLNIEARILDKITVAARSIGVHAPVEEAGSGEHSFAPIRKDIEALMAGDPTLYERGGTARSAQTAEQYRQTLRKALEQDEDRLRALPRAIGSGLATDGRRGFVFCFAIGDEVRLATVPCDDTWSPLADNIDQEIAACLRRVDCDETASTVLPAEALAGVFQAWSMARSAATDAWNYLSDPRNIHPRIDRLNRLIADRLRRDAGTGSDAKLDRAIRIIESPWDQRDKRRLSSWFGDLEAKQIDMTEFVRRILQAGIEPYEAPPLRDPIAAEDVELVAWMALSPQLEAT